MSTMTPNRPAVILIVEDNPGDVELTREAFEASSLKHKLHFARDGDQALDFLYQRNDYADAPVPDIILLDLNLPGTSGLEVLDIIKKDKQRMLIPVIIISSSNSPKDILAGYSLHANCYVVKPVLADDYMDIVHKVQAFWTETAARAPLSSIENSE